MRYRMFLLPLAVFGLFGCIAGGAPSPQRTSATYMGPARSVTYMTPQQSASYITLPGNSTEVTQTGIGLPPNEVSPPPDDDSPQPPGL